MKLVGRIILATALLSTIMGCRKTELPDFVTARQKIVMEASPKWSKGGVGMIHDLNLFVHVHSSRNEITWNWDRSPKNWIGQSSLTPEVVVFCDGNVWPAQSLPHGFNKGNSVVISFEKKSIRFYDYIHQSGGYYERF
jgi:hypothetical protein